MLRYAGRPYASPLPVKEEEEGQAVPAIQLLSFFLCLLLKDGRTCSVLRKVLLPSSRVLHCCDAGRRTEDTAWKEEPTAFLYHLLLTDRICGCWTFAGHPTFLFPLRSCLLLGCTCLWFALR